MLFQEKGITLLEILVAITIFSIASLAVFLFINQGLKAQNFSFEQSLAISEARRGVDIMVKELREAQSADSGAYAIEKADANELIFFSDIDKDDQTERIHFWLSGTDFKKGVIQPTATPATYPALNESVETLSRYVRNTSTPVFTYYNFNIQSQPLATPVDPKNVRYAGIYLRINVNPLIAPQDFDLTSNVHLRNLQLDQ
jgi:prepilin-type N-terminal cleavage/methylation domain-containing protein